MVGQPQREPVHEHQLRQRIQVLAVDVRARRFGELPYVRRKGSFRFDVGGLARRRFERVHSLAKAASDTLPGAAPWLERNRRRLDNKYFASKFYLLAVVLPWLAAETHPSR